MQFPVSATIPLAVLALLFAVQCYKVVLGSDLKYPPGPPADFIIGHARKMPKEYGWKTFGQWKKQYGECPLACRTVTRELTVQQAT